MTYQNRAFAFSIGVPTPRVIVESVDVVPNPSGDRRECGRPPSSCRNSMTARTLFRASVLWWAASSCRHRWLNPVGGGLLVSPSLAQTVGYADQYSLPIPHSCHYCGTNPGFDFLLVSLTWFKPRERLSLENGGCVSIHTVRIQVSELWYKPGGK